MTLRVHAPRKCQTNELHVALNMIWPLLLLGLPLWIIHAKVIPREEWALTQAFGDDYRAYQKRVRRWL